MMQEESDLFEISLTEQGKTFIRKFAGISYTLLVFVIFIAGVNFYWDVKVIMSRLSLQPQLITSTYYRAIPYLSAIINLGILIGNFYYLRFPRALNRSIKLNDEFGANQSFKFILKAAYLFLVVLIVNSALLIWTMIDRGSL